MTYVLTASRDQEVVTREEHDDPESAYRRATDLVRTSHLVILSNRENGVVQHYRNKRPKEAS